jgi:Enoyl-(Acyl carrier protein) reductase
MVHRGREAETIEQARGLQPWPDYGRPEHVAGVVAFLAGDDSVFMTGQALVIDGGRTAAGPGLSGVHTRSAALVGVNKGSTGEPAIVRERLEAVPQPNDGS